MTYKSIDIANFIVSLGIDAKAPVTNLKLQKIMYFLNAAYLVESNQPLIDDQFSRWAYGPVIESIYAIFKSYGAMSIKAPVPKVSYSENDPFSFKTEPFSEDIIHKDDRQRIKQMFDVLNNFKAFQLVNLTHEEPLWLDYQDAIEKYSAPKYDNNDIRDYFINNELQQIWKPK
ncbi:Panacea domain-containing protein [Convivina praedatoris]|uniref:Antitoxin SocA-like Panacea domain-containing protein n=1 Tax=Convivina praedatoris TaxID=2880963 RepID=A0ABM9D2V0_9LACO|nr:type II toxin-antitoxin system antitoxin SocA domain-containing protein [Convivina sp. LMG 32447]CAH1856201.1 hypothetical protein LMG032447_01254 [Convivina sp. LMG 32447]